MALKSPDEIPVIWLQAAACSGCAVSVLNAVSPNIRNVLIDEVLPGKHINLRFHPVVMAGQGDPAIQVLEDTHRQCKSGYVLIIEGAIPTAGNGIYCTLGENHDKAITMRSWVEKLGRDALAVIALGTCAAFGGIPAATPNPTGCQSVSQIFQAANIGTPVVNIPGCPPHPDWFTGTVASILLLGLPKPSDLDEFKRPKAFYRLLIHENCPRRAYYDECKFAKKLSDPGCLYELGCKGPVSHADCPTRLWNNGISWCVGSGAPCSGCVEPGFPDLVSPFYEKMPQVTTP